MKLEHKQISKHIQRFTCPNPSVFTFKGTNCYVVGDQELTVVDPGPMIEGFIPALIEFVAPAKIKHILITHTHKDHSPAARELVKLTGAQTYYGGKHEVYRTDIPNPFQNSADWDFRADVELTHEEIFECDGIKFRAIKCGGHCKNHTGYELLAISGAELDANEKNAFFVGDHIMGWASTIVAPPDGNMSAYMESLEDLQARNFPIMFSGHGASIRDPKSRIEDLIKHRMGREAEIIASLEQGLTGIEEIVLQNYPKIDGSLRGPAMLSVLSQMEWLMDKNMVKSDKGLALDAAFSLL